MIFLTIIVFLYSISYLVVYVLAHQDANMIKPLTAMTAGMLVLLFITALVALFRGFWYISLIVLFVIIGMIRFFFYLSKY
jgi:hypothetical protein